MRRSFVATASLFLALSGTVSAQSSDTRHHPGPIVTPPPSTPMPKVSRIGIAGTRMTFPKPFATKTIGDVRRERQQQAVTPQQPVSRPTSVVGGGGIRGGAAIGPRDGRFHPISRGDNDGIVRRYDRDDQIDSIDELRDLGNERGFTGRGVLNLDSQGYLIRRAHNLTWGHGGGFPDPTYGVGWYPIDCFYPGSRFISGRWWYNYPYSLYPLDGIAPVDARLISMQPTEPAPAPEPQVPAVPLTTRELGEKALYDGQAKEAVRLFEQASKETPSADVNRWLGMSLLSSGKTTEATAVVGAAYLGDPSLASKPFPEYLFGTKEDFRTFRNRVSIHANKKDTAFSWLTLAVLMQAEGRDERARVMLKKAEKAGLDKPVLEAFDRAFLASSVKKPAAPKTTAPAPKTTPTP